MGCDCSDERDKFPEGPTHLALSVPVAEHRRTSVITLEPALKEPFRMLSAPFASVFVPQVTVGTSPTLSVMEVTRCGSPCRLSVLTQAKKRRAAQRLQLNSEVARLASLDHPGVLAFLEALKDRNCYYLVLESCPFGSLLAAWDDPVYKDERLLALLAWQVLGALAYIHSRGIVHGNLTPAHLLLLKKTQLRDALVKLTGFGTLDAVFPEPCSLDLTHFRAPDAVSTDKTDVFSLGVILYTLATGTSPYSHSTAAALRLVQESPIQLTPLRRYSSLMQDFLCLLLRPQAERPSALEARTHSWLHANVKRPGPRHFAVLRQVQHFQAASPLRDGMLIYIFRHLVSFSDWQHVADLFSYHDPGDSLLRRDDLARAFAVLMPQASAQQAAEKVLTNMKKSANNGLSFSEFLAAALGAEALLTTENIRKAFANLDLEGAGSVALLQLRRLLTQLSGQTREREWPAFMHTASKEDGKIQFSEFAKLLKVKT